VTAEPLEPPRLEGAFDNDDQFIQITKEAILKRRDTAAVRHVARTCGRAYLPIAHRAYWCYSQCKLFTNPLDDGKEFIERYLEAWSAFFIHGACAFDPSRSVESREIPPRTLVVMWHFPEYPKCIQLLRQNDAVLLVARYAEWMSPLQREGKLLNFRDGLVVGLVDVLKRGKPIVTMLDYCYDNTHSIFVPFLGHDCRTATGLLKLAERFNYAKFLLGSREGQITLDQIPYEDESIEATAWRINRLIETQILLDPPRWLLWPSLDARWRRLSPR